MAATRSTFNFNEVVAQIESGSRKNAKAAALLAQREIQQQLTGQRTGAEYKVSKTGEAHVASAPGESPAVLSGDLRGSISTAPGGSNAPFYYVGSDKEYAPWLELGTKHIAPRPFFVKAVERAISEIKRKLAERVD